MAIKLADLGRARYSQIQPSTVNKQLINMFESGMGLGNLSMSSKILKRS